MLKPSWDRAFRGENPPQEFPGVFLCQPQPPDWQFLRNINPTCPSISPAHSKGFAFPLHRMSCASPSRVCSAGWFQEDDSPLEINGWLKAKTKSSLVWQPGGCCVILCCPRPSHTALQQFQLTWKGAKGIFIFILLWRSEWHCLCLNNAFTLSKRSLASAEMNQSGWSWADGIVQSSPWMLLLQTSGKKNSGTLSCRKLLWCWGHLPVSGAALCAPLPWKTLTG